VSRLRLTKIAAPASPAASTQELYYDTAGPGYNTPAALTSKDENGVIAMVAHYSVLDYRLLKVVTLTSGTTYTPTNGTRAIYVEAVGGGAGGGGCATAVTNAAAAGGGGAGGYSAKWLTGISTTKAYVIGAGGAGGVAGANNGSVGSDTTFNVTDCVGKGGSGGLSSTVTTAGPLLGGNGGAGGVAGTGDIVIPGTPGDYGLILTAALAQSGGGGDGFTGSTAQGLRTQSAGANAVANTGAGGSGGCILSGGASVAGGNGASGWIRVWEFA
jgi:hypothetical protein